MPRFILRPLFQSITSTTKACAKRARLGCVLSFLLVVSITSSQAKDRGVINDPDGYVNLRRGKSTTSSVVAKVKPNEPFTLRRTKTRIGAK